MQKSYKNLSKHKYICKQTAKGCRIWHKMGNAIHGKVEKLDNKLKPTRERETTNQTRQHKYSTI